MEHNHIIMKKEKKISAVAGYEFVCKNKKCEYFKTGFSLYKEWPISDIDEIINSKSIKKHKDLKAHLVKCKNEGRKHALTTLPNSEKIPIVGKRIQLFCKKDGIIWERDLVDKNDVLDMYCDKCKERLVTADEAKDNGILCPKCKIKLTYTTWFSNI